MTAGSVPPFPPLPCGSFLSKAPRFSGVVPPFTPSYLGWEMHTLCPATHTTPGGKKGSHLGQTRRNPEFYLNLGGTPPKNLLTSSKVISS